MIGSKPNPLTGAANVTTPRGTIPRVPPSRAISSLGRVICLYRLRTGPPTIDRSIFGIREVDSEATSGAAE